MRSLTLLALAAALVAAGFSGAPAASADPLCEPARVPVDIHPRLYTKNSHAVLAMTFFLPDGCAPPASFAMRMNGVPLPAFLTVWDASFTVVSTDHAAIPVGAHVVEVDVDDTTLAYGFVLT